MQVVLLHATTMVDGDVRQPYVADRMPGQSGDAAAHRSCVPHQDVVESHAIDATHMVHGCGVIAPAAITQTDKDGRLGALDGEVRNADILQHASVHNLQRDGRRAYPLSEELLLLVAAGLHHDARDVDVAESPIGLRTQLHGITVARHHTVADSDVFAQSWRRAFQRDAVVVAVGYHPLHDDLVTTVQVQRVVVVVVAVLHLDAYYLQAVAG